MEVKWRFSELPPYEMIYENQSVMRIYGGMEVFGAMGLKTVFFLANTPNSYKWLFQSLTRTCLEVRSEVSERRGIPSLT